MSKNWRRAVRREMKKAAVSESNGRSNGASSSFNYRWEHVTAVVTYAMKLADILGADKDVVEAAAWLHDVNKSDGDNHARSGASFARSFLRKTNFPKKKIDRVAEAIGDHQGLWRKKPLKDIESMILWDADKLSKIGLTAAFHWTGKALAGIEMTTMAEIIASGKDAEWQEKTVASMHTKPAKKAAKKRLKAYNRLWADLETELNGDDIKPKKTKKK